MLTIQAILAKKRTTRQFQCQTHVDTTDGMLSVFNIPNTQRLSKRITDAVSRIPSQRIFPRNTWLPAREDIKRAYFILW